MKEHEKHPGKSGLQTLELISPDTEPDYSEDGVDLTLVRWMLSLTPTERLEVLQGAVRSLARLKDGIVHS
jgi:hypothetical protein